MNGSATDPGIIHQAVKDIFDRIQMVGTALCTVKIDARMSQIKV